MEETLSMTNINDFLFCPRSLYYGNIFRRSLGQDGYQQTPQKTGLAAHETIDEGTYSTRKDVLTGTMVYCEKYGLLGRIDIYDRRTRTLTERKYSVSAVWEGFRMQLYAQYFALQEMGCEVASLRIHSQKDNKTYHVPLPTRDDVMRFETILGQMRSFSMDAPFDANPRKCPKCIYRALCDACKEDDV